MTATHPQEQEQPKKDTVTVTVDGVTFESEPGELLIKAAQDHGVYIPRFCWHERMKPVGMCRMCLVEVDGMRGYPPACTTPVAEGMVAHSQSDVVRKIQDDVLEFLLINHPLDCPVCDRGGECPLQDQTLAFGPGESRFVEEKRHFEKPIPLSKLVLLDRERCIQCARCTRFADEIAGDPLIDFVDRGEHMQVLNFAAQPFDSYFSGNTVQICPVGALTATQYRFRARPWDLSTAETSCTTCAVQCRGALQSSSNRLVRLLGVDSEPVNHGWLCDKGRYNIEWVHSDCRRIEPAVRAQNQLVETSWPEALDVVVSEIRNTVELHGPGSVAVLGGARGTNEDAYAWARLAKGVVGTDNVDAQLGDGLPADAMLGLPRAEIADCDRAAAIVVLDGGLEDAVPVLALRLRRAVKELEVPLVDCAPVAHKLSENAALVARSLPGEPIADATIASIAQLVAGNDGPVVVVLGRGSVAESVHATLRTAALLSALPNVRFLSALRRGNVHGALDAGLAPGFLPGRVDLAGARQWFGERWGQVPAGTGLDAEGILRAAAEGKIHVLVLLGANPLTDFPDAALAKRGVDGAAIVVAVDAFVSDGARLPDVFLPCTVWGEKTGTVTNLEGRVQRVSRKVAPEGTAMDDWRIAGEIAFRMGHDFDFATVDEVTDEIARVAPAALGVTSALMRRARDGVVLPLSEHLDEVVLRTRELSIMSEDGHGASWDPIKVEGVAPGDSTAAVEATGTGATTTLKPGAGDPGDDPEAAAHALDDAREAVSISAPDLHTWDQQVPTAAAPARDAYALRLVSGRQLYDAGRAVQETLLRELAREPELHISPHDLARLGVDPKTRVRVTSATSTLDLVAVADERVPAGVASLAFFADGEGAAKLIDVSAPVTDLRVETLS